MLFKHSRYLSLGCFGLFCCFVLIQAVSPCVLVGELRSFAFKVVVEGSLLSLSAFVSYCSG